MNPMTTGLSAEDRQAVAVSLQLDEYEKRQVYDELILEKWSKVAIKDKDGKVVGNFDWLGEDAESLGFPKLMSERSKLICAHMLENQNRFQRSKQLKVVNGFVERPRSIMADTGTADEALPTNFAMAMVRRTYALMQAEDWAATQPLPGPSGYVWFLDFLREQTGGNALGNDTGAVNMMSADPSHWVTAEGTPPQKSKLSLQRTLVQANKLLEAASWTLEASEDAMAQLGLNVEQEMIAACTEDLVRSRFYQHLNEILAAAKSGTATGTNLAGVWAGTNPTITIPQASGAGNGSLEDWAKAIYNSLVDADVAFMRRNRRTANSIVCGLTMGGVLQKAVTAVAQGSASSPAFSNDVGLTDYGNFSGRFHIQATDLLPDNQGILYVSGADTLRQGYIYAPYVPIQAMPAVYGGYDPATGNYRNTDEYTRNLRERSASVVTRPYAFIPLQLG